METFVSACVYQLLGSRPVAQRSLLVSALLLLYDVTNKTSYDNIRAWLSEIREHANEDVVIMLLGEFRLLFEDHSTKLHKSSPSFFYSETTLKFNVLSNNLVLLSLCKQACFHHTIQQACLTTTTLLVCFLYPHPHMIPLSYYICFKIEKKGWTNFIVIKPDLINH